MKKKTIATTIALSTLLISGGALSQAVKADTINGIQVTSHVGHKIELANGQVAYVDGTKVYIDGQEVILAPDVIPVQIPTQQEPTNKVPTQTIEQGIPTPVQKTPDTPKVPDTPNQQTPTKTPNTPVVTPDPKTPSTPNQQTPTKNPTDPKIPTEVVENVPVKTFPQKNDNTPLPTQTIETHTTTVEKENIKPIVVPKGIKNPVKDTDKTATKVVAKIGASAKAVTKTAAAAKTTEPLVVKALDEGEHKVETVSAATELPTSVKKANLLPETGEEYNAPLVTLGAFLIIGALSIAAVKVKKGLN